MIKTNWKDWIERDLYRERMFLKGLILLLSAWHLGVILWVGFHRFAYPFELEWTEGAVIQTAIRILNGLPIYTNPGLEWASPLSSPLYYYLGAALMSVFGEGFAALRIISLCASIGTGLLIYRFLRNLEIEDLYAFAGFGLYFAAFSAAGGCYDLAHRDSLALLLALSAYFIISPKGGWERAALSAAAVTLSVFTSQYYLLISILLGIFWFVQERRNFYVYLVTCMLLGAAGVSLLYAKNGLPFLRVIITLPRFEPGHIITFWLTECPGRFLPLCLMSIPAFYLLARKIKREFNKQALLFMMLCAGLIIVSYIGFINGSEYGNAFMPAGLALAAIAAWTLQYFKLNDYRLGWLLPVAVKVLVIAQLCLLIVPPQTMVPTEADTGAGRGLIDKIASIDGEVYIPKHGYYEYLAGKESHFPWAHLSQITGRTGEEALSRIPEDIKREIKEKRFSAIILDEPAEFWLEFISPYYYLDEEIFEQPGVFKTKAGEITRPQFIFRP